MFEKLKCSHENNRNITNIHGDCINMFSPTFNNKIYRSQKECLDCGAVYFSEYLDKECKRVNQINNFN